MEQNSEMGQDFENEAKFENGLRKRMRMRPESVQGDD